MSKFAYARLADTLFDKIQRDIWQPGQRIPAIRKLAEDYQVSRNTIQHALHILEARGILESRVRSGYYVVQSKSESDPAQKVINDSRPEWVSMPDLFHTIMARGAAFDVRPDHPSGPSPNSLNLLNRHLGRAIRQAPYQKASYYTAAQGDPALRQQISQHYRNIGLRVDSQQVCITAGCQNALVIALMTCCQPGDTVAVESPAFYGVLQALQHLKLKVLEIPASPTEGMSVDRLAQHLSRWPIQACVVTPNYATPTGACMPSSNRKRLVELCAASNVPLIEDDIYGELGFHIRPDTLKHYDRSDNVILCSSLSKSLSRDLRLGWVIGGRWHDKLVRTKLVSQLASPQALQQGVASYMAEGHYKRHLSSYRQRLVQQRDDLLALLKRHWQVDFRYVVPDGGLTLWLTLPREINSMKLYGELSRENIIITPGALFSAKCVFNHCLRASFAHALDETRKAAWVRVGEVIAAAQSSTNSSLQ